MKACVAYEKLDWPEQLALFVELRETGCPDARERLILANVPLATTAARDFAAKYPGSRLRADDFEAEAMMRLIEAVDTFDPACGFRFTTYACKSIYGQLRTYQGLSGGRVAIKKGLYNDLCRFRATKRKLDAAGLPAADADVFASLGWTRLRAEPVECVIAAERASANPRDNPSGFFNIHLLPDREHEDGGADAKEEVERLLSLVKGKDRFAVEAYYGIGRAAVTLKEAGKEAGVSEERARQWRNRAIKTMRAAG